MLLKYRKDLDGLRCLAVMAVIFYHAGISVFGFKLAVGGFFGVDIFLVISGFLITSIIFRKLESNSFSLMEFFSHRIKRIIPALILILATSSIFAYYILMPDDLIKFSNSIIPSLSFYSNYHFLGEESYVSDASSFKPLLHTWSLALEWQFYVIYPFIIILIHKLFKKHIYLSLSLLAMISLLCAHHIVKDYPDIAFYTLPSRAWEFILGGITAIMCIESSHLNKIKNTSKLAVNLLAVLGMAMVLGSICFIDSKIGHPSFITLIPVIGTCLVIGFSHSDGCVTKFLSIKPFVFIGTISYSLYLWHQPIFVFFRFMFHEYITLENLTILVMVAISLSYFSYKYVENPFRSKSVKLLPISIMLLLAISVVCFSKVAQLHEGFQGRVQASNQAIYEMYKLPEFRKVVDQNHPGKTLKTGETVVQCGIRSLANPCRFGDESWVVIGDSYAGQYENEIIKNISQHGHGMISLTYEACPFVNDMWFGSVPECVAINKERWQVLNKLKDKKKIIISSRYDLFPAAKEPVDNFIELANQGFSGGELVGGDKAWISYAENIKKLVNSGNEVYLIYQQPYPSEDVKRLIFTKMRNVGFTPETLYTSNTDAYIQSVDARSKLDKYLPDMKGLHKIYPSDALCDNGGCRIIDKNGGLYNIDVHLSGTGAKEVLSLFMDEKNTASN